MDAARAQMPARPGRSNSAEGANVRSPFSMPRSTSIVPDVDWYRPGRAVARPISAFNGDGINPTGAVSGSLSAEIQSQRSGDHPIRSRGSVARAVGRFVAGHGLDLA